jgi:Fe-S cluster biogenesis protein NfuA
MAAHDAAAGDSLEQRLARVDGALDELAELSHPAARSLAEEVIATVLELHEAGLRRALQLVERSAGGEALIAALSADELVRSLLLLHGLHPEPLLARVERALESVRPFMAAHKGGVELLGVEDGVVHLRLQGTCNGCGASTQTIKNAVEKAIYEAAPDAAGIEVEGLAQPPPGALDIDCLTPLPMAGAAGIGAANGAPHPSLTLRPVVGG